MPKECGNKTLCLISILFLNPTAAHVLVKSPKPSAEIIRDLS